MTYNEDNEYRIVDDEPVAPPKKGKGKGVRIALTHDNRVALIFGTNRYTLDADAADEIADAMKDMARKARR